MVEDTRLSPLAGVLLALAIATVAWSVFWIWLNWGIMR